MATYSRRIRIAAPLEAVWAFHGQIDGLEALTPGWMGLRVEGVVGPDGDAAPAELFEGSEITMASRPFGVAPESRWLSRIVARERDDGYRMFRDDMLGGPFAVWVHTHEFYGDGEETVMIDTVEYEFPAGPVGPLIDRLASWPTDRSACCRRLRTDVSVPASPDKGPARRRFLSGLDAGCRP